MVAKKFNKETNREEYESMMMDFSFSHSPGIMTESDSIEYLKLAHQFIVDWFPDNEVFSSVIHLDEKTPHSHIWVSFFDEKDNRFNQRKLRSQRKTDITLIRNAFQTYLKDTKFKYLKKQDGKVVGKHGYDGSKANTKLGKAQTIIKKKNETIATLKEVNAENKQLRAELEEIKAERKDYAELEEIVKSLREEARSKQLTAEKLEDTIDRYKSKLNELKADLGRAEVAQSKKDAQIADLEVLLSEKEQKSSLIAVSEDFDLTPEETSEALIKAKVKQDAEIIDDLGTLVAIRRGEGLDIGYTSKHKELIESAIGKRFNQVSKSLAEYVDQLQSAINVILGKVEEVVKHKQPAAKPAKAQKTKAIRPKM